MGKFKFAIMGAGNIAVRFCDAVSRIEDAELVAVASKSMERAEKFAKSNGINAWYDSYERMLEEEKPDCVYIAVLPNDHHRLTMLCLEHRVPVICEKAMFMNSAEAREVFEKSEAEGIFVMEALWSRFLPTVKKVRQWIEEGAIGNVSLAEISIGFLAEMDPNSRFLNASLGGGAAYDVTVYAYELLDYFVQKEIKDIQVSAVWGSTGVDVTDLVTVHYEDAVAVLLGTFAAGIQEKAILYGDKGKIEMVHPHYTSEAFLYPADGSEMIYFRDDVTDNGFVYEAQEAMDCIRAGRAESRVVPHSLTLRCAELFDRIMETKNK